MTSPTAPSLASLRPLVRPTPAHCRPPPLLLSPARPPPPLPSPPPPSAGEILSIHITLDPETNLSRGFGFVSFNKPMDAAAAMASLNGYTIMGKRLKVMLKNGTGGPPPITYPMPYASSAPGSPLAAGSSSRGSSSAGSSGYSGYSGSGGGGGGSGGGGNSLLPHFPILRPAAMHPVIPAPAMLNQHNPEENYMFQPIPASEGGGGSGAAMGAAPPAFCAGAASTALITPYASRATITATAGMAATPFAAVPQPILAKPPSPTMGAAASPSTAGDMES